MLKDANTVTTVRVVCHDCNSTVNHWRVYFLLADGESSIRLDTKRSLIKIPGQYDVNELSFKRCQFRLPHSRRSYWDFSIKSLQLMHYKNLLQVLYERGYYYYKYAENGYGCRWFVYGPIPYPRVLHGHICLT